jgi:hypothetical protein
MKINLRKASALQNAIQETMRGIAVNLEVKINEFQTPETVLNQKAEEVMIADSRRNDLLVALYSVRAQVNIANAQSGVSDRLARAAYTDKRIEQLGVFASAENRDDIEVIKGKLEKIKTRPSDSRASLYGHHDDVTTGVLPREALDQIKAVLRDMKKQKQRINDEILELNVRTEVELSPEVVAILEREKLV